METNDFKVNDKRASSGATDEKKGETFVASDPAPGTASQPSAPNQVDFSALCLSLATGAMIGLGLTPDPSSKKTTKNLEMAKQNIDILDLLKNKTKGNLTPEESHMIEALLTEVRFRFVEATKK